MKQTIVIIQRGKSIGGADKIELKIFTDKEQADGFCEVNTDLDSKYWTYCEILEPNKEIEIYYNHGN